MKIGFIAEPYEESGASGMGYMVRELIRSLAQTGAGNEFTFYSSIPISKEFIGAPFRNVLVPASLIGKFWWFMRTKEDIDALMFVTPLLPLWVPKRIKTVVICPELGSQKITPGTLPGKLVAFVRDRLLLPTCFARASKILSISQATKEDIQKYYGIAGEKIEVVYIAYQDLSEYAKRAPAVAESQKPFFFFTGRVKPRKNVHGIVSAFIQFRKDLSSDCKLVIAGSSGGQYRKEMEDELSKAGLRDEVFFVGYVSTEQLCAYYLNTVALVFPSINEGFGMPVLEAMSLGAPVITSNISSLPEVAEDAGILVDPYNITDIAQAMERVFTDTTLRQSLIAKGYKQVQKFSWNKTAQRYLQIVAEVIA